MICSAFTRGASAHESAQRTAMLIDTLATSGCEVELALGVYKGQREIAVIASGYSSVTELLEQAMNICIGFRQECVYVSAHGEGHLVHSDGRQERIGFELDIQCTDVLPALFGGKRPDSYTERLDGRAITTAACVAVAA